MRKTLRCQLLFPRSCGTEAAAVENGLKLKPAEAPAAKKTKKHQKILPGSSSPEQNAPHPAEQKQKKKTPSTSSSKQMINAIKEQLDEASQPEKSSTGSSEPLMTRKGHVYPKSPKAWAVPTKGDLEELGLPLPVYWHRMWFLRFCASTRNLEKGSLCHSELQHLESHVLIGTQLIDMYGKCREPERAYEIFQRIERKNLVAWNFMLGALVLRSRDEFPEEFLRLEYGLGALRLFSRLILEGEKPNAVTLTHAINACSSVHHPVELFHKMASAQGFTSNDTVLGNALVGFYCSTENMIRAKTVFRKIQNKNVISWTQLVTGYTRSGDPSEGVFVHWSMNLSGVQQDRASLVSALDACASSGNLAYGQCLHRQVYHSGLESDVFAGTSLVHLYGSCGRIDLATRVFNRVSLKNEVTWNSMIAALVKGTRFDEALVFFERMELEGIAPDRFTLVPVMDSCAQLQAIEYGKRVQRFIMLIQRNEFLRHSVTRFFGNCGKLQISRDTFYRQTPIKTPEHWTSLIEVHQQHGFLDKAIEIFHDMQLRGFAPIPQTLGVLLAGCSQKGRMSELRRWFHSMIIDFEIAPELRHFGSVLHLLGRKGRMAKMQDLIQRMPFYPGSGEWLCLLAASEIHKDVERGELAARRMLRLDPRNHLPYEILANIYVEEEQLLRAGEMAQKMIWSKQREASFIEIHGKVYKFLEGYKQNRMHQKLDDFLQRVRTRMRAAGYVFKATNVDLLRGEVGDEIKHHSEGLAVAFGVLRTRVDGAPVVRKRKKKRVYPEPIRVVCKHRMCSDCHAAIKYVSMEFDRRIVVRDSSRFHHFQDGLCSCRDFW